MCGQPSDYTHTTPKMALMRSYRFSPPNMWWRLGNAGLIITTNIQTGKCNARYSRDKFRLPTSCVFRWWFILAMHGRKPSRYSIELVFHNKLFFIALPAALRKPPSAWHEVRFFRFPESLRSRPPTMYKMRRGCVRLIGCLSKPTHHTLRQFHTAESQTIRHSYPSWEHSLPNCAVKLSPTSHNTRVTMRALRFRVLLRSVL
mgnify:CR=1 FL=1